MMQRRLRAFAAVALLSLAGCAGPPRLHGTRLDASAPPISLRKHDGRLFDLGSERGKTIALFFGYTHCPDVCPTTLAHVVAASRRLPKSAAPVRIVFVTIDPGRDSPAVVQRYAALFAPSAVGLSGTAQALKPVYRAYHVWAQRLPSRGGNYDMAHSSELYLIAPDGRIRAVEAWDVTIPDLVHDLRIIDVT